MTENGSRAPQPGDFLILADGRRFVLRSAEHGLRGWWLHARAQDDQSMLQGNLRIEWDEEAGAWRPVSANRPPATPRTSRHRAGERSKQGH